MIGASVVDVAAAVETEFERLKVARPALFSRISRAENILITHLSCRRQRTIRVRVAADGRARFLVQGSGGAVYVVDPASWQCSCPDAHRRGKGCKHGIACWALERASRGRPAPILAGGDLLVEDLEHVGDIIARGFHAEPPKTRPCSGCGECFRGGDLFTVGDDSLAYFEGDEICSECALDCDGILH